MNILRYLKYGIKKYIMDYDDLIKMNNMIDAIWLFQVNDKTTIKVIEKMNKKILSSDFTRT